MNCKKIFYPLFLIICFCSFVQSVENSVVPLVAHYEEIGNLPAAKYSKAQHQEIVETFSRKSESLRIATFNILCDSYKAQEKEYRWAERLPRVLEVLHEMQPDLIGVQELYPGQTDLLAHLEQEYTFFAKPCNDGEMNGIFYRTARFEVVKSQIWYMSATPEAAGSETVTMLQLKDKLTGKTFAIFNTHLAFSKVDKREFRWLHRR